MNNTEDSIKKDEKDEQMDSSGTLTCANTIPIPTQRKLGSQQRVFIDMPANDSQTEVSRIIKVRSSLNSVEDAGKPIHTGSLSYNPIEQKNMQITIFNSLPRPKSLERQGSHKGKMASPIRELRNVDVSLQDSANTYIEASNLLRDERDLFRNCALEMLDFIDLDKDTKPVQFDGAEIVKCGILKKKATKNPILKWKEKYVIVTLGRLIWFPLSSAMIHKGDVTITDKMRKEMHFMILNENTEPRCSLNRQKNVHHIFDVIYKQATTKQLDLNSIEELEAYIETTMAPHSIHSISSETSEEVKHDSSPMYQEDTNVVEKHFMCQSDEERDSWLRAIRSARLGRNNDPAMWSSQHIFIAIRNLISRANHIDEIERILNSIVNVPLCVPVYFIQSISQGCRGPTMDPQLNQVMRDLNRETVILGERSFHATLGDSDTFGFPSKIIFLLMESIRRKDTKLKSWDLLRFARQVLLHTYRSQTGGDCFDALTALLNQTSLVMIMPVQMTTSKNPIRIDVTDSLSNICDIVNKEGPYVTSFIDSFFTIMDKNHSKTLFNIKATVKSIISRDNSYNPWTLELLFSRCCCVC